MLRAYVSIASKEIRKKSFPIITKGFLQGIFLFIPENLSEKLSKIKLFKVQMSEKRISRTDIEPFRSKKKYLFAERINWIIAPLMTIAPRGVLQSNEIGEIRNCSMTPWHLTMPRYKRFKII